MVGVVIPVHGFAPYLAETLDGILAQDPAPDAVVVVDDESPTPLSLHPDHAGAVSLVRRSARGGPAAARGTGLEALDPRIELVALCDGDDTWEPGKLAAQVAAMQAAPEAGLCFGRALVVGPDGRPTGEEWARPAAGLHTGPGLLAWLYESNPIPTSCTVLRRSALAAVGGFTSADFPGEDWDWELWLRLAASGAPFLCVPEAVVRYRRHPGGLTADVAALARFQLALHERHGALVSPDVRARVLAADATALRRAERRGWRRLVPRRDPYRR